jgi:hypothetical protein
LGKCRMILMDGPAEFMRGCQTQWGPAIRTLHSKNGFRVGLCIKVEMLHKER